MTYTNKRLAVRAESNIEAYLTSVKPKTTCIVTAIGVFVAGLVNVSLHHRVSLQFIGYLAFTSSCLYFGRHRVRDLFPSANSGISIVRVVGIFALAVLAYLGLSNSLYDFVCRSGTAQLCSSTVLPISLLSVVLAPYVETIISNGFAQTFAYHVDKRSSLLVGATVFIVPHFSPNLFIIANGFAFAIVRHRVKSLGAIIICHALTNVLQAVIPR